MPRRRANGGAAKAAATTASYTSEQRRLINNALTLVTENERTKLEASEHTKDTMDNLKEQGITKADRDALKKHAAARARGAEDKIITQLVALHDIGIIIDNDLFAAAGISLGEQTAPTRGGDNVVSMSPPA